MKRELDLTRVRVVPIRNEAEQAEMLNVYRTMRPDAHNGYPVATTHMIVIDNEVAGGFCLESPTVYWWMVPERNTMRHSMSAFGCLETLMLQSGRESYLVVCEESSSYYKVLEKRLPMVMGEEDSSNWNIFIREIPCALKK